MTKALLLVCCGAMAAELETLAPVISLSLADGQLNEVTTDTTGMGCEQDSALCRASSGTNGEGNSYVEKYSRTCEAGSAKAATCSLPAAHAWDHRDGNLQVTKIIKLLNNDGVAVAPDMQVKPKIDYNIRSEWAIEYDAVDNSGNKAEQLIFTLVLDDTIPPTLSPVLDSDITIESCDLDNSRQAPTNRQYYLIPYMNTAHDNIDGDISDDITITIKNPAGRIVSSKVQKNLKSAMWMNTFVTGTFTIVYTIKDRAGMFGFHGESNMATKQTKIHVQDTTAPELYCEKSGCALAGDSLVQQALWSSYLISSKSGVGSVDECCDSCTHQEWNRKVGTTTKDPACGFFSYTPTGTCHLFARGLKTLSNNVEKQTGTISGYPIDCRVRNSHECGTQYTDAGARCIDMRDSIFKGGGISEDAVAVTATGEIKQKKLGDQIITYSCSDSAGNPAAVQKRYVEVTDTQLPVLKITHNGGKVDDLLEIQHSAGYSQDIAVVNELVTPKTGYTCSDKCDGDITNNVQLTWYKDEKEVPTGFDSMEVGTWVVDYSCQDSSKNIVSKTRTIHNQDKDKPILNPICADTITIQADDNEVYDDCGATCSDQIDGVIDHKVATSGDVVRTNVPGTYHINYYCEDESKNSADMATRTIIVEDTKCPSCTLKGGKKMKIEAAFDFNDPGAKCVDSLDGKITATRSGHVDTQVPGKYTVTYTATDSSGNPSFGANCKDQPTSLVRTVIVEDTLKPVIVLTHKDGSILHTSNAADTGLRGVSNGAGIAANEPGGSNPYLVQQQNSLMAEQSTVNGWLIGALASAITGVALLAFARSSGTAVPV
jgi:hypothetical protein